MDEPFFRRMVKFLNFSFIGMTTFAMQLFFTVLFTELFRITYYFSYAIALAVAWTVNFMFNMKLTFDVHGDVSKRFRRFALIAVVVSLFNWLLVVGGVELLNLHYLVAILIVSALLCIVTFKTEEVWVFQIFPVSGHKKSGVSKKK